MNGAVKAVSTVAVLAAVSGCGSASSGSSAPKAAAPAPTQMASHKMSMPMMNGPAYLPPGAARPSVRFTTPHDGLTVGPKFTARVALKNFKIDPNAVGMAPRPGRGHLHFILDGGKFDYPQYSGPNGVTATKLGVAGYYSPALAPEITYQHLPAGPHTLEVALANNNHTPVGVTATVHITVR